jgi:hypothetical protein
MRITVAPSNVVSEPSARTVHRVTAHREAGLQMVTQRPKTEAMREVTCIDQRKDPLICVAIMWLGMKATA